MPATSIEKLRKNIIDCKRCPRLIHWCQKVATEKKKAYQNQVYWGKPVPGFGDPQAKLLIVGLAPGAHGANRTGRMFTGDRSGQWLYRALFTAGLSNQETYQSADDGLKLKNTWISNVVRCAPPQNKPNAQELLHCQSYLLDELSLLKKTKVILVFGGLAWNQVKKTLQQNMGSNDKIPFTGVKFGHGQSYRLGKYTIIGSYHPSQQNTFTGRLTQKMLNDIFIQSKKHF